jgi:hypothetical protein
MCCEEIERELDSARARSAGVDGGEYKGQVTGLAQLLEAVAHVCRGAALKQASKSSAGAPSIERLYCSS